MKRWCILDMNYLCYRAWFAMGKLSFGDVQTGMWYGVFKDIIYLQDRFMPKCFIFCFDYGKPIRSKIYPAYKSNRIVRSNDDFEIEDVRGFVREQTKIMRRELLPSLGYHNIFYQKGYEADDCIAKLVLDNSSNRHLHHIIVSSDHDLFQLLGPRISLYKPSQHQLITDASFSEAYGVSPSQWVDVKSIAGCKTDTIEGIPGVGEKTAAKWISGKLKATAKAHQKIVEGTKRWKRNIRLVQLPYPGLQDFQVCENETISKKKWLKLMESLGMESIKHTPPGSIK